MVNADHNAPSRQRHPKVAQLGTRNVSAILRTDFVHMLPKRDECDAYKSRRKERRVSIVTLPFAPAELVDSQDTELTWAYSEPRERLDAGLDSEGVA